MNKQQEPYESMPEGKDDALSVFLTKLVSGAMVVLIIVLLYALSPKAEASEYPKVATNWCAQWQEAYEYSFYLKCRSCQDIEPKQCPTPEHPSQDGTLKGIKDGAADGVAKQKGMQS